MKSRTAPCAPETPLQLQHYIASSLWKCFCFFVQGPWAPFRSIGIHHGFQGWKVEWKWSGFFRHETFMKPCFSFRQHPGLQAQNCSDWKVFMPFFRLPNLSGMLINIRFDNSTLPNVVYHWVPLRHQVFRLGNQITSERAPISILILASVWICLSPSKTRAEGCLVKTEFFTSRCRQRTSSGVDRDLRKPLFLRHCLATCF